MSAHDVPLPTNARRSERSRIKLAVVTPFLFTMALVASVDTSWLIEHGKAGQIQMKVDDFYAICGRDNVQLIDLQNEGMFSPALTVRLGSGSTPSLTAEVTRNARQEWTIGRTHITDTRFHTAEGIHVGRLFLN